MVVIAAPGCAETNCKLALSPLDQVNGQAPFGVQFDFSAVDCNGQSPPTIATDGTFWVNGPDGLPVDGAQVDVNAYSFDATHHFSMGFCPPADAPEGVYTLNVVSGNSSGSVAFNVAGKYDGSPCFATRVAECGVQCDKPDCGGTAGCCERVGCAGASCGDDGCGEPCGACDDGKSCGPNGKCSAPWTVAGGEQDPRGVTTDAYFVYWTLDSGGAVKRANKDGSEPVLLGAMPGWSIRVDSRDVFWTAHTEGKLYRAAKDGTDVHPETGDPLPVELVAGQQDPRGLALDDDHVYWTDVGDDAVRRVSKEGGAVQDLATKQQGPRNVFVQGDHVYWTNSASGTVLEDGTVNRVLREGGALQILAADQVAPWGVYVDDEHVYWTSYVDNGQVLRMPKDGGTIKPELVAHGFVNPRDITGDVTSIYWNAVGPQNSNGEFNAGSVFQLRKDLSLGQVLAQDQKWIGLMGLDSSTVYWAASGTLDKIFFLDGRVLGAWKE